MFDYVNFFCRKNGITGYEKSLAAVDQIQGDGRRAANSGTDTISKHNFGRSRMCAVRTDRISSIHLSSDSKRGAKREKGERESARERER